MAGCKVAVIGAGSYVFGPSVLDQAILQHALPDLHLALVDVDGETLDLMANVARRMARETGVNTQITTHTERTPALDGARFVICSASPQMHRRFAMDCDIINRMLPGHLITEFGGIAGLSYSLRQIALIENIAYDMSNVCPDAWLLNVANPLPRVCQAAHERDIKTAGFCSVSMQGYGMISRLLDNLPSYYPFAESQAKYQATMAGVNHFTWLCGLKDRATGADLLPLLRERVTQGATCGHPRAEQILRQTGWLLVPGDDHTRDFLAPQGAAPQMSPSHGSPDERVRRLALLRDIGEGRQSWDTLLAHPSWEKPFDLIAGLAYNRPARLHSLNLINASVDTSSVAFNLSLGGVPADAYGGLELKQIPQLPDNVFVETACQAGPDGISPDVVQLPPPVAALCRQAALITDTIAHAAALRSLGLLHTVVELDPTILDKQAGCAALDACLHAHADLFPAYK